jgi:uncharacterized integral membrane protein
MRKKAWGRAAVLLVALVLVLILILQNTRPAAVNFFFLTNRHISLALLLLIASLLGFAAGMIVTLHLGARRGK